MYSAIFLYDCAVALSALFIVTPSKLRRFKIADKCIFLYLANMLHNMTYEEIGIVVLNARKRIPDPKGRRNYISQAGAANMCDVSPRTYKSIELGEGTAGIEAYQKISLGLNCPFSLSFPLKELQK